MAASDHRDGGGDASRYGEPGGSGPDEADGSADGGADNAAAVVDADAQPAKRRWLGGLLKRRERVPATSRCVVVGPSASGKTLLLMSLQRCVAAGSHSYARRFVTTIGERNTDFKELQARVERDLVDKALSLDASKSEDCLHPGFTLHVRPRNSTQPGRAARFETFDGAGGLLVTAGKENDPGFVRCRSLLEDALERSDTVILCLPIWAPVAMKIGSDQEDALLEFIHEFLRDGRVRDIVVCLTMYEMLGLGHARHAYRALSSREAARTAMRDAFSGRLRGLGYGLRQFHMPRGRLGARRRQRVWCVPVSSYGFVPYNGGANAAELNNDWFLRTRPRTDQDGRVVNAASPYPYGPARNKWWSPFLTIDPFAFVATGSTDTDGTLIHALDELDR